MRGTTHPDFTFGAQSAEVAVDIETGQVKVIKIVSCYDVGKALNKAAVEGQMEGGSIYGMGYALYEDYRLEKGVPKLFPLQNTVSLHPLMSRKWKLFLSNQVEV